MKPLQGIRLLSLALNLPGPAALMRCRELGARCIKIEPDASRGGDPMQHYNAQAYNHLHRGITTRVLDLKSAKGQAQMQRELGLADVLLTSFRPSALKRLGLSWRELHPRYPGLSMVAITGGEGAQAEVAGHDLTYLAACGLLNSTDLPPTLYADMAGSLITVEAVLAAVLTQKNSSKATYRAVSLAQAAQYLALPRTWGLTLPTGAVGGAHAGYQIYPCQGGRAAVAALEPHFANRMVQVAGLTDRYPHSAQQMDQAPIRQALALWFAKQTKAQLQDLALAHDLPIYTLASFNDTRSPSSPP
jgi:alpha-methylacyl-CoA racemase